MSQARFMVQAAGPLAVHASGLRPYRRQPACPERRLCVQPAMGAAMVVTDVLAQDALCVSCRSSTMITLSRHSRRRVRIALSQYELACGALGGMARHLVPKPFTLRRNQVP
jgi:hypothetical protein